MKNEILLISFKYKLQNKFNLKLMFLYEKKVKIQIVKKKINAFK